MTRQALVGLFTIAAVILFAGFFVVLTDFGTRARGYEIGVHFQSAAGIHPGASVFLSGVPIGTVDRIILQPDYTTDVIASIKPSYDIPQDSRFLIQAPLTGEPSMLIVPPPQDVGAPDRRSLAVLPRGVLPIDQQPRGRNSATVADLLDQGQGEIKRFDQLLAELQTATPTLLRQLQTSLKNTNTLTVNADRSLGQLTAQMSALTTQLARTIDRTGTNIVDLTGTLDTTVKTNSSRVTDLLTSLQQTANSLDQSTVALNKIAGDPRLHDNVVETTHQLAETAKTVHELLADFRQVTGNAQTQGQLRDAAAQLDATTQRINSLAGSLGGRSSVYGVDAGATPIPAGSPPPATGPPPARRPALGTGFISGSIRFSELAPTRGRPNRTPVLGSDRGPQTDVNLTLLPHAPASLFLGANDIGGFTTANFALIAHRNRLDYGGGLLYSRLGILARVEGRRTDFETRLYDPRHPTLDAYAGVRILPQIDLFAGYRDLLYPERRAVFGLQFSP